MERNFFDRETDRKNTFCEKWDDRSVMEEGGIPLWVADMDFACAPEIMEAIRIRSEHPCFGYTSSLDYDENTEVLCGFWKRRHGLEIAAVYGDVVKERGRFKTTGRDRTDCICCGYGCQYEPEPNRFQQLKETHPAQYKYCMDKLGLREVLDYIGVPYE